MIYIYLRGIVDATDREVERGLDGMKQKMAKQPKS